MKKFKCLIVDDEPIAREIMLTYCGHLPYLQVEAACGNALEAKLILQDKAIDILFLDINMPVLDGIGFLKTLKAPPRVIFTTAYKEYAISAFDLSASDYLLKPFSLERFIMAVDKAIEKWTFQMNLDNEETSLKNADFIFIKSDGKIYKILFDDLLFAEANGNFTKIITTDKTLMPSMAFSSFEELVPKNIFVRVHRSFIINKTKISHIEGNRILIDKSEIPIGGNYKDLFIKELGL